MLPWKFNTFSKSNNVLNHNTMPTKTANGSSLACFSTSTLKHQQLSLSKALSTPRTPIIPYFGVGSLAHRISTLSLSHKGFVSPLSAKGFATHRGAFCYYCKCWPTVETGATTTTASVPSVPTTSTDLFTKTFKPTETLLETKEKKGGKRYRKPDEAWASARRLKVSPKKLNIVAAVIRGRPYTHAVTILQSVKKRSSARVLRVLQSCRYNAENNHGLDPSKLYVSKF
jgi:hypothetical protein